MGIDRIDGGWRLRVGIGQTRRRFSALETKCRRELARGGVHRNRIPGPFLYQLSSVSQSIPADSTGTLLHKNIGVRRDQSLAVLSMGQAMRLSFSGVQSRCRTGMNCIVGVNMLMTNRIRWLSNTLQPSYPDAHSISLVGWVATQSVLLNMGGKSQR